MNLYSKEHKKLAQRAMKTFFHLFRLIKSECIISLVKQQALKNFLKNLKLNITILILIVDKNKIYKRSKLEQFSSRRIIKNNFRV